MKGFKFSIIPRVGTIMISVTLLVTLTFIVCCSDEDEYPQYNPPSDHTINNDGVLHKSGLSDPTLNCVACHGIDLKGGASQVSCYGVMEESGS